MSGGRHEIVGSRGGSTEMARRHLREANDNHETDRKHVHVRGHSKGAARFTGTAQVERRQNDDESNRDGDFMTEQRWHGCGDVTGTRGNRDGDRQDVVDQQSRGHKESPGTPEVRGHNLIIAATRRIGVDSLPVGSNHDCQDEGNHNAHPHGLDGCHASGERQR